MGEGGRIVTVGSGIATRASFPGVADYAATKAAIIGYTKGAARDLGPRGITVNVLQPGSISTDMNPDDGREFAAVQRSQHVATLRHRRGDRCRCRVPRKPAGLVRDRHGAQRRWRLRRLIERTTSAAGGTPQTSTQGTSHDRTQTLAKLGGADHGWLKAKHHFSFGSHYDPDNMGHGSLRVWNDDEIAPNTGFPAHPHANMEIITYVREGAITHQDSLGTRAAPKPVTCR